MSGGCFCTPIECWGDVEKDEDSFLVIINGFPLTVFLPSSPTADSQRVQDSIECGVAKLESTVDNLNVRLARLLAEYSASQAKLKQRIAKLELRYYYFFCYCHQEGLVYLICVNYSGVIGMWLMWSGAEQEKNDKSSDLPHLIRAWIQLHGKGKIGWGRLMDDFKSLLVCQRTW